MSSILPQGTQFSISERTGNWGKIARSGRPIPARVGDFVAPDAGMKMAPNQPETDIDIEEGALFRQLSRRTIDAYRRTQSQVSG